MKNFFARNFGGLSRKKIIWILVILVILVGAGFFFFSGNGKKDEGTMVASRGEFVKEISVSGKVVASENVDLSFAETGRVATLNVEVGDEVTQGQVLASLSTGSLQSELTSARATLAQKMAENSNTQTNLDEIKKEQDTLVANAYAALLSNNLQAVASSNAVTATPPIVTGLYNGSEGTYKFRVKSASNSITDDFDLLTFDLERIPEVEVLDNEPTPLGTRGLFVSFPEDMSEYQDTSWYVTIPNTKSATYTTFYNAYQEALRTRDRVIADAGAELAQNSGTAVSEAEIQSAQAEIARIQSQIAERTIVAPFSGVITAVDAKLGGVASANSLAISLISTDTLQIESFVPEIHIPFIRLDDEAVITLDAYGPDSPFSAKVISIDPAETIRDGVSTYRAKLEFSEDDERIKSGMTANVVITSEKKSDVISVPQSAVVTRDGQKFVFVKQGDTFVERMVTIGGLSSLGEIEIIYGVDEGDIVNLNPTNITAPAR